MSNLKNAIAINWKTTVAGILGAIGVPLSASEDETIKHIGLIMLSIAALLGGVAARDYTK